MDDIIIGDHVIEPGESKIIEHPYPAFYGMQNVTIPIYVRNGKKPGPKVLVTGCIHGDEINGMRICHVLMNTQLKINSGTLIIIPIVNIYGFLNKTRYLPDRKDLNRCFPGSKEGSFGSRLAHAITSDFLSLVDVVLDLHSGGIGRFNIPQIRCDFKTEGIMGLLEECQIPLIVNSSLRDGSFRQVIYEAGKTCLVFEGGEGLRFDEAITRQGAEFVKSVLYHLGMLSSKHKNKCKERLFIHKTKWIRAERSGIVINKFKAGKIVREGEVIGEIRNNTGKLLRKVRADHEGVVLGKHSNPLVMAGDALYNVGYLGDDLPFEEDIFDWGDMM